MNYPSFEHLHPAPGPYNNSVAYPEMAMYPGPPQIGINPVFMKPGHMIQMQAGGTPCQFCGRNTHNLQRTSCGCTAMTWGIGLCIFFFPLFWLPCCVQSMRDVQFVCSNCGNVKTTIPASCC